MSKHPVKHKSITSNSKVSLPVTLLRSRAQEQSEQHSYTFLVDGETEEAHLTYRELDRQAQKIAARLQSFDATEERALLLYPPGLDYIAAFFGCLYANVVAVPAYPPDPSRLNRSLPRLQALVADAGATMVLTTTPILSMAEFVFELAPDLKTLRWLATDTLPDDLVQQWQEPTIQEDSLAFLQYTSGSTSAPKGVMLTHGNLRHNSMLIHRCFEHTKESRGVIWLPPYHDMGLIGGILQPLYAGIPVILMSPLDFLKRPFRWLQAISRYRATTSGGPNFAYDLCVRKIKPEQRATLDLSSWKVAFNGAEPIRQETMERFAAAFASCGFEREAFYPCYGLAEATLIVSGGQKAKLPVIKTVEKAALAHNRIAEAGTQNALTQTLVSCGTSLADQEIVIADPQTFTRCSPNQIGEIWVAGPSIAQGYWEQPEETSRAFQAYLADTGEGPFLRTGDLGFLQDGELFVTGRLKDLIIIRGRNYYPNDIERTVEQVHTALRPGCCAAFSVEVAGEERLVITQEVRPQALQLDLNELVDIIRQTVAREHALEAYGILLLKAGTIAKTSSGKIQRHACRADFLADTLETVHRSLLERDDTPTPVEESFVRQAILSTEEPAVRQSLMALHLRELIARVLQRNPSQLDLDKPVSRLGLDSLMAVEIKHEIESSLGTIIPMASILSDLTLEQLATTILTHLVKTETAPEVPLSGLNDGETIVAGPASYGQQALWFVHQLNPESAAYNIHSAVRILSDIDVSALKAAFLALVQRHPILRTTFTSTGGQLQQHVQPHLPPDLQIEETTEWMTGALEKQLIQEAHRPFNLEEGPLLRVRLYQHQHQKPILLFVIHHIVSDFWSLAILFEELGALYQAERGGRKFSLAPPPLQYRDYSIWQEKILAGPEGERLWSYWKKQLAGRLSILNLPADKPRPSTQIFHSASFSKSLNLSLTRELKHLSQKHGATLYMTLLAAFQTLLHRYSGQDDILVGSPAAGRQRTELAQVVGYFVNPLVMRADLSGNPSFAGFLQQTRQTVLEALKHQDYPFALLTERLHPERSLGHAPLFQAMFIYQKPPSSSKAKLAAFALGKQGTQVDVGGLTFAPVSLEQQATQFDVTLTMAEIENRLEATLQYNSDVFSHDTMQRLLDNFQVLLESIVTDPGLRVSDLPLLAEQERQKLLVAWNDTRQSVPQNQCIHTLFEAQVKQTPEAIALIYEDQLLSYGELNQRANRLAHYLQTLGAGPDIPVGICMKRTPELVISLLAILKAGSAYVPLDPTYPAKRLAFILSDVQAPILLTQPQLQSRFPTYQGKILSPARQWKRMDGGDINPQHDVTAENLAYLIHTSGSTGKPKGVMVNHKNVMNFFQGMDTRIGCDAGDTLLALTSISFDISVLELFWTLTRGARVVLLAEEAIHDPAKQTKRPSPDKPIDFSLFYFAADESETNTDKYHLLRAGAQFADAHDFSAVWTPERHFHAFGGLYPNPAITGAALAALTRNVQIRAGSVVLPLHNPVRVAEDWSVIDNLSHGRVGIAFASGWHADDFVFFPDHYDDRKAITYQGIERVRQLWRGQTVQMNGGKGNPVDVRILPRPIQPELPIWITAAGSPETFIQAGKMGAHILTHLLGQSLTELGEKLNHYRQARAEHGHDPEAGIVSLMLHTFIGDDLEAVREVVWQPFTDYLRTSIGLMANLARSLNIPFDVDNMRDEDMATLLQFAFERYFNTGALFGTPDSAMTMIEQARQIGVNEIACLIDFGIDPQTVLNHLPHLHQLRQRANGRVSRIDYSLEAQARRYKPTLMQCTPSMMRMLALTPNVLDALKSLRVMMLGGEALPPVLARQIQDQLPGRLTNMYGPTETTIWSTTHEVRAEENPISIGRPIANTQIYILDGKQQPVPIDVTGELYVGGDGVTRGYYHRPHLTAERFVPHPFSPQAGRRLYKTGDLARYRQDGTIEFLGRLDHQVKIRGFRIELGEIETTLSLHSGVRQTIVVARAETTDDQRLVAYVVPDDPTFAPADRDLRNYLQNRLPAYMIPSHFVFLEHLPLTANGKVDRKALPSPHEHREKATYVAPRNRIEQQIASVWCQALKVDRVGINDNFFDLGGHSLLMAQIHSQLNKQFQREIPLMKLLEYPTIRAMAQFMTDGQDEQAIVAQGQGRAQQQRQARRRRRRIQQRTDLRNKGNQ